MLTTRLEQPGPSIDIYDNKQSIDITPDESNGVETVARYEPTPNLNRIYIIFKFV